MTALYPQQMPVAVQQATRRAAVVVGPMYGYARAPFWLSAGPERSADDLAQLHADKAAIDDMFSRCPVSQWCVAAQAVRSMK